MKDARKLERQNEKFSLNLRMLHKTGSKYKVAPGYCFLEESKKPKHVDVLYFEEGKKRK